MPNLFPSSRHALTFALWMLAILAAILLHPAAASAQTSPALMLKPWDPKPHMADSYDEPIFIYGGHLKDTGGYIGILHYDSFGRVKPQKDLEHPDLVIGYDILVLGVDSYHPGLTTGYADLSIAASYHIGEIAKDWDLSIMGGGGQANDNHFDNNSAYYGIAGAAVTHTIDEDDSLVMGIGYNGNRTFLPDIPLPYAMYSHKFSDELRILVGAPFSKVEWKPLTDLTLDAGFTVPFEFSANADYKFDEHWSIFGDYHKSVEAYYLNDQGNTRMFYELSQVKTGVRFIYDPWIDVAGGVGWAFDQEFSTGYEFRNTNTVAQPTDTPIIFIRVQGTF